MSSKTSRVCNWPDYNKALIRRGSITLWIDESVFTHEPAQGERGRPFQYANSLIEAALTLKSLFHLSYRSLQGFLASLLELMDCDYDVPNYTTLCRRQSGLKLKPCHFNGPLHLLVDSTGLKIYGEGEWCVKKHGATYQRTWRKVHLGVDADSLEIVSCQLSGSRVQDSAVLATLLNDITTEIDTIIADGAYDTFSCYEMALRRKAKAIFPPRRDARLSAQTPYHKKAASDEAIGQRDETIEQINRVGRRGWKQAVGYHKRSLVETTMYRLKALMGDRLRAKTRANQHLELMLRVRALNKMITLGRPCRVPI